MSPLVVEQELERERKRKLDITKTVRGPYARFPQVQYVY